MFRNGQCCCGAGAPARENLFRERTHVRRNPFAEQSEPELAVGNRSNQELERSLARNVQIESVHQQKRVSRRKSHTFIAIHEGMIINQRLQQRRGLLAQVVVVTRLWAENGRFQSPLIEQSALPAVLLNLLMVNGDDFSHGQIDTLGRHLASFLYNSRYFSLERR